ncbi:MAG TPA: UDP-N-acetylglucosamine 1-carboxyvinyltransferase, partial [Candidatus Saccharimonadales bacterium]|nr:UDP-N-acetylglucosamine 1-carboxyvinyltransferase [Candidatus Saccharimonadales bacterium]
MARFEIEGNAKLSGKIKIAGNKNAVLPIMAACLLTQGTSILENVPNISDVDIMAQLLELCGAKIARFDESKMSIKTDEIKKAEFPNHLTEKLRASVLLIGPMLSRVGEVKMGYPGGDLIGRRPLETHIRALESLGAKLEKEEDCYKGTAKNLKGADIFLPEASVTATENVLMAAVLADGDTTIKRSAAEPHVVDLCKFLVKMGAHIEGIGTSVLRIRGVQKLQPTTHTIVADHIEVGTFAILAAVTPGTVEIQGIVKNDLDMILHVLKSFNVDFKIKGDSLIVGDTKLKATERIVTDIWPGFATDLMAPTIVLATQAEGVTILHDWMYESRMFFVDKLLSMGAKVEIADPHRVLVYGPSKLRGQRLDTPDIRAGIALVIAALAANGTSHIERAELIERG